MNQCDSCTANIYSQISTAELVYYYTLTCVEHS